MTRDVHVIVPCIDPLRCVPPECAAAGAPVLDAFSRLLLTSAEARGQTLSPPPMASDSLMQTLAAVQAAADSLGAILFTVTAERDSLTQIVSDLELVATDAVAARDSAIAMADDLAAQSISANAAANNALSTLRQFIQQAGQ